MSDSVHTASDGRLRRITLNRPEKRNALDSATCRALVQAIEQGENDRAVGAILLDARSGRIISTVHWCILSITMSRLS